MNSICRWDSDDFRSDVYCYEDDGEFVTHVARTRYADDAPRIAPAFTIPESGPARRRAITDFCTAAVAQREWLLRTPLIPLGGPHAGETFIDHSERALLRRLNRLRDRGYRVPESVFERLRLALRREGVAA